MFSFTLDAERGTRHPTWRIEIREARWTNMTTSEAEGNETEGIKGEQKRHAEELKITRFTRKDFKACDF